jgi:hypothetical protein
LPPVEFSSFVLTLSTSALMYLGAIKNPATDKIEKDQVMAKHTIDVIEMLKDKTKGNLKDEEAKLMDSLLYDLRMRYVKAGEESGKTGE